MRRHKNYMFGKLFVLIWNQQLALQKIKLGVNGIVAKSKILSIIFGLIFGYYQWEDSCRLKESYELENTTHLKGI